MFIRYGSNKDYIIVSYEIVEFASDGADIKDVCCGISIWTLGVLH